MAKERSFINDSPWSRVAQETSQWWELRREYIAKIEKHLGGKVIVYFTSFFFEDAMVVDKDAEMIENMLSAEHTKGNKIILILNSAGGSGLAAERIVNICQAYSNNQFEVIVPHMAKSAATLICFGASCIRMSATAELGPVDPQIKYIDDRGQEVWISADEYVRSYDNLMKLATSGEAKRLETLLQQLSRYDARNIEQLKSSQELSKKIAIKLLKAGMMSAREEKAIEEAIAVFLVQKEAMSHGRMINMKEAQNCGLNVKEIELQSDLWNWLWEVFIRGNWVVSNRATRKILESANSAVFI
jgi:ClpP class serine protease